MTTLRHDSSSEINQRFDDDHRGILDFCDITPRKRERMKEEQDRRAYDSLQENTSVREELLTGQLADFSLQALKLLTRIEQSAKPILARALERRRLAEERVKEKKAENPATYRAEAYVDLMLISEINCDIEEFQALLLGLCGDVQAALFDIHSIVTSAWRTRGNLDTNKAIRKASEQVGIIRGGIAAPFADILLQASNRMHPPASTSQLPPTEAAQPAEAQSVINSEPIEVEVEARPSSTEASAASFSMSDDDYNDDPIEFFCIQGGRL